MELGIIGLPTSGKTTIFNALTHSDRPTAIASTGRLELFSMVVDVPDERVDTLSKLYNPKKTTYAKVTYTDIAGLDQDLGKTGLTGELRNKIAPMDAFVHIVRAFENSQVPHLAGSVDPQRDLDTLDSELMLADAINGKSDAILELAGGLAAKISRSLQVAYTPEATAVKGNIDAALLFSRGVEALDKGKKADARRLFEACLAMDSSYRSQIDAIGGLN